MSVASWPPPRYSPPLSEDFPSDGDRILQLVDLCWTDDHGKKLVLDNWQRQLIRHVLEVYPEGHKRAGQLRYRECFVSVARQNGKSVIGSILAMYGLLRESGALVVGLASTADQANIVYKRVLEVIQKDPRLEKRFKKATMHRGIVGTNGSTYLTKASKSDAVQGLATSLGIIDELHITSPALWSDLLNGIAAKPRGLVFGITTAGDEDSELLIRLYKTAEDAPERFGYFIWEAPESHIPEDDEELGRFIKLASPSIAEGRREVENEIAEVRSQPETDAIHFKLNRFVASLNPYMRSDKWNAAARGEDYVWPEHGPLVYSIEQTTDDTYATISATRKTADGRLHTELAATFVNPNPELLLRACEILRENGAQMFAMDRLKLGPLANELKRRGYPVWFASGADIINASSLLFLKVMNGELEHSNDVLLNTQMARTVRKQKSGGDAYRIDKSASSIEIDAVMATAIGVYVAEQQQERPLGIL
ncbi:terminase large subunit domain-containing protein [Microbacterium oleivorans]|uniref:Terminase large subunit-like ATPase domain-containing protein n=1 Tax=Microbacterium oleivorans TaxID=273677 RepID=A0A4R5YFI9_9MICO|nr:terminase large subunit [Microbacterium oleivorans]TDL43596.1 hypothetical protein E2R54_10305 [Microbacterium oleivorans]